MKCGVISDLHIEALDYFMSKSHKASIACNLELATFWVPPPSETLDVLFIAGDICESKKVTLLLKLLHKIKSYARLLIVIDGNHENWNTNHLRFHKETSKLISSEISNLIVLNGDAVTFENFSIFGCCLWSNFGKKGYIIDGISGSYPKYLKIRDLNKIKKMHDNGAVGKIRASDFIKFSDYYSERIESWLKITPTSTNKILLTHFPPLAELVPDIKFDDKSKFSKEELEDLKLTMCTDLSHLITPVKNLTLVHGHIHNATSKLTSCGKMAYTNPRGEVSPSNLRSEYRILEFEI